MLNYVLNLPGLLISYSNGDVFLHNPRGSNNRLNGNGANRQNNNRLFDSQVSLKPDKQLNKNRAICWVFQKKTNDALSDFV